MADTSVSDDNTCETLNENTSLMKGCRMGNSVCIIEANDEEEDEHDFESGGETSSDAPETLIRQVKLVGEHSIDASAEDDTCGTLLEKASTRW